LQNPDIAKLLDKSAPSAPDRVSLQELEELAALTKRPLDAVGMALFGGEENYATFLSGRKNELLERFQDFFALREEELGVVESVAHGEGVESASPRSILSLLINDMGLKF
jgi:hypothetical protein